MREPRWTAASASHRDDYRTPDLGTFRSRHEPPASPEAQGAEGGGLAGFGPAPAASPVPSVAAPGALRGPNGASELPLQAPPSGRGRQAPPPRSPRPLLPGRAGPGKGAESAGQQRAGVASAPILGSKGPRAKAQKKCEGWTEEKPVKGGGENLER